MSPAALADFLARLKIRHTTEADLQAGIAEALTFAGCEFRREALLTPTDRIDFLIEPGIGVEVKIKGSASQVEQQLLRYADSGKLTHLLLVTTRSKHREVCVDGVPYTMVRLPW